MRGEGVPETVMGRERPDCLLLFGLAPFTNHKGFKSNASAGY